MDSVWAELYRRVVAVHYADWVELQLPRHAHTVLIGRSGWKKGKEATSNSRPAGGWCYCVSRKWRAGRAAPRLLQTLDGGPDVDDC